ncbi:hypothetical protein B0H17DRAFT_1048340 [Mycena rosella]|uniref:F-box domain-containing protein n=1 Tax=Mycena rosella TaxID=1033263 RepID=A0AAD7DUG0_MYCRO|nr:hypothetical protein B0H17DRAFT_1048340 [Mycena rosella]
MPLQKIPPELIEAICVCLDALSIVRLSQVSRQFHSSLQNSSALQYKIQLELAGLRDGQSAPGSAVRLDMLKAYQAEWASFDWTQIVPTKVPMEGHLWELVGNVVGTYDPQSGFAFTRIPSITRHISLAQWSIPDVPFNPKDFSMDFSQDLLLVVEFNTSSKSMVVHLLFLQTGRPHPLARTPSLSRKIDVPPMSCQIRIFGEHIGVMVEDAYGEKFELLVWEWKSGNIKKHISQVEMTSFAFLDNRRLLVTALSTTLQPELRVLDIDGDISGMRDYFSFRLPALSRPLEDIAEIDMMIQTEPAPSWPSGCNVDEPFTVSHTDRLYVVSLVREGTSRATFMLCFLHSTLVNLMDNSPDGGGSRVIRWDIWGPHGTRMLRVTQLPDPWVCFVYGQRCILQTGSARCQILDFNPLSASQGKMTDERTVDKRRRLFLRPVSTSAPFALNSVDVGPSAAVMLAEDAVVSVSPAEDEISIFSV